jgi:hypothetical protein
MDVRIFPPNENLSVRYRRFLYYAAKAVLLQQLRTQHFRTILPVPTLKVVQETARGVPTFRYMRIFFYTEESYFSHTTKRNGSNRDVVIYCYYYKSR